MSKKKKTIGQCSIDKLKELSFLPNVNKILRRSLRLSRLLLIIDNGCIIIGGMKNNLTELGIRLGKYLHYKRIGTNQLGRMMGSSGALASNILNGKNFGMNKFFAIGIACPDLNLCWLLTGEGEMLLDGKAEATEAALREGQSNKKALESEFKIGSLETAVRYQDMTIGAYKAALSAVLTANKDLKEVVSDHLKTISRLTGGGKTT